MRLDAAVLFWSPQQVQFMNQFLIELMQKHVAFLHTAPIHVATFGRLMSECDPTVRVDHFVQEALLVQAQCKDANPELLQERVQDAMREAASQGASVVVCTCSSIGAMAEKTATMGQFSAVRIDRALADQAVQSATQIWVVAALESTLGPTTTLLQESAAAFGVRVEIKHLWVKAWPLFEKGETSAFIHAVVSAIQAVEPAGNAVFVLAQASMAPAEPILKGLGIAALSSPRLGVQSVLALRQ
jgi:hypothetical protein